MQLARLTGWKGQRVLIEALALPPLAGRADLVVVLAGDAQGRDDYRRELQALVGGARRCRVASKSSATATTRRPPSHSPTVAVVASTEAEAFGRTAVEAAAMGVPVVATALGATDETVLAPPRVAEAERTGWLVPPGDAAALAAAIDAALQLSPIERGERSGVARAATRRVSPPRRCRQATLALYDRLLSRSAPTASRNDKHTRAS